MDEKKKFEELRREVEELRREWGKMRDILSWVKEAHQEATEWPKDGDLCWYLDDCGDVEALQYSTESIADGKRRRIGNVFRTLEDAEKARELLKWFAEDPARRQKAEVWKRMMEMADGGSYSICIRTKDSVSSKYCVEVCKGAIAPRCKLQPSFSTEEKAYNCIREVGETTIMRGYFGLEFN